MSVKAGKRGRAMELELELEMAEHMYIRDAGWRRQNVMTNMTAMIHEDDDVMQRVTGRRMVTASNPESRVT